MMFTKPKPVSRVKPMPAEKTPIALYDTELQKLVALFDSCASATYYIYGPGIKKTAAAIKYQASNKRKIPLTFKTNPFGRTYAVRFATSDQVKQLKDKSILILDDRYKIVHGSKYDNPMAYAQNIVNPKLNTAFARMEPLVVRDLQTMTITEVMKQWDLTRPKVLAIMAKNKISKGVTRIDRYDSDTLKETLINVVDILRERGDLDTSFIDRLTAELS